MDDLDLIKQKINVVDLLSEYLTLKKAGVNYKANCPFHNENTPSFMISPERGIWHCFGCGRGGDIFKFIMEKEGLEFTEALEMLAQKAGVKLKKGKKKENNYDRLYEANEKSMQFYHYLLTEHPLGKKALDYLTNRGLTLETIKEANIGYAPNSWDTLTKFLKKRSFKESELIESGLCVQSKNGCYDRFRGRIIFPLIDLRNRVIGFSGRVLDQGEPKYINTPQTPIFDKRKFLFGFNLSKGKIKEKNEAIMVEGEMDMLMSYQSGVKNIVAVKGTGLTEEEVEALKRHAATISLCFDMDIAGDMASRRSIEMADRAGLNLKVIQLTGGKDPAEINKKDPSIWEKAVKEAIPVYDYYLQSVSKRYDVKSASAKKDIMAELIPVWKKITDPIVREHYIEKLAALLQVKDDFIRGEITSFKGEAMKAAIPVKELPKKEVNTEGAIMRDRRKLLEEYLITLLLHVPIDHTYIPNFPETLFTLDELKQIYVLLVLFLDSISFKGKAFRISDFIQTLPPELIEVVDRLYLMQIDEKLSEKKNWQREIDMVIFELKKMLIKVSLEKLSLEIKSAQEFDRMEKLEILTKRFRDLSVKLKNM